MKRVCSAAGAAVLLLTASPAGATLCARDVVPGASLLLPAFLVDIGDADLNGQPDCFGAGSVDTAFSVVNASAAPVLVKITLWTDWSFPTLNFDVFLTGYDVQPISLCQLIGRGRLPRTADEARDPMDTISPHQGGFSNNPGWDGTFPGCDGVLPLPPKLPAGLVDRVQNAHAGYVVSGLTPANSCAGSGLNGAGQCAGGICPAGTLARGYVTIDNVNACSTLFPTDTGYFAAGGTGVASNGNALWGDWFLLDRANNFAQGDNLVRIEAHNDFDKLQIPALSPADDQPIDPASTPTGTVANTSGYTFYGRYASATGGIDNREPLGTTWATRHIAISGGSSLVVWRDSTADLTATNTGFPCGIGAGSGPSWFPLNETQVVCFDEAEDAVELCFPDGSSDPVCFPAQSQMVDVGVSPLAPPHSAGWCLLNLNPGCTSCTPFSDLAQSHVGVLHRALGRYSVGLRGVELTSACKP